MIFGPVSSVKGNRCIIVALVLTLTVGVFAGVATFVVPSEAATSPPVADAAPTLLYGVGEGVVYDGADTKSLGIRRREVAFDAAVLASIVEMKDAASITLALFDDVQFLVDVDRSSENLLDVRSFSGRVVDRDNGYFMMSLDDQGKALIQVDALDEGLVYIVAVNPETGGYDVSEFHVQDLRAPNCSAPRVPEYDRTAFPSPLVTKAIGENIAADVLVVYTPAADLWARTNRTGINNVIAQAIQKGNNTFESSDVDMRLRLVHSQMVDYEEKPDYLSDLDNVTFTESFNPFDLPTDDFMPEVHEWRDQYGADLVVLMNLSDASSLGYAGVAWILTEEIGAPQFAFAVASAEYADISVIHELGHNLGCHHSRAQSMAAAPAEGGLYEYSTGWRWEGLNGRRYVSTMTYQEFDYDTLQLDVQVPLFSNPDIEYAGAPTGSYVGEYAPADNARSIREIKNVIAGYREQVVPDDDEEGEGEDDFDPDPDAIWYVNALSPFPTQDGASWESPFKTIAQALAAASDNHEIWVARGLYEEGTGDATVTMMPGVRMYGGFIGLEENKLERDIFNNPTGIDGLGERPAVVGANDAVLDGFILVNGGMLNDSVSMVVRNCAFGENEIGMENINSFLRVTDCYFGRDPYDIMFYGMVDWGTNIISIQNTGGTLTLKRTGIFNSAEIGMINNDVEEVVVQDCTFKGNNEGAMSNVGASQVTIQKSIFLNNRAQRGAAIDNATSTVTVEESSFVGNLAVAEDGGAIAGGLLVVDTCSFRENIAVGAGGAIALPEAGSEIRDSRFSLNQAGGEGGGLMLVADVLVENCLVYGNSAGADASGAGIAIESGSPEIWNTNFVKNFGYALHNMTGAATPRLTNCILWANDNTIQNTDNAVPVITYSNVQGGAEGQGNIDEAPLFRNLAEGDMYLLEDSPCVNSGTDTGAPVSDIVGVERPQDGQHDMGAWEYAGDEGGDSGEGPAGAGPDEGEAEGEGEEEDKPTASFEVVDMVRDKEGLLPLHDWVPLFRFTMKYGEDEFAPRFLQRLVYTVINDTDDLDDRGLEYAVQKRLHTSDILEFGLFEDNYKEDDDDYGNLTGDDRLAQGADGPMTWDHTADFVSFNNRAGDNQDGYAPFHYEMNFLDAPFIPTASREVDDREGNAYIVAVRTSATWRSQLTLGINVLLAEMIDPGTGEIPIDVDDEGVVTYTDDYSPDFYGDDADILEPETWYSASFGVYDPSGPNIPGDALGIELGNVPTPNFWQHTSFMAVPTGEFTRPRWNKPGQLMSMFASEYIEERRVLPLEEWTSVIGINLHSTRAINDPEDGAVVYRADIILTDVGADPYGPEGNGGFNPKNALKPITGGRWEDETGTYGHHVIHNGLWLWRDVDNNGYFEAPTPEVTGGVAYNNDLPLPGDLITPWEYIPFPPGGGDPWWKTSIEFYYSKDVDYTYISPTPNNIFPDPSEDGKFASEFTYDYYIVARCDSGFRDCSLRPASNTGATFGAEFRAFIEPKRLDPFTNEYAGGLWSSSQMNGFDFPAGDDRWMPNEPWWPERTLNATAAKPYRLGVEVHDLVLTYNSSLDILTMEDFERYYTFNFHPMVVMSTDFSIARLNFGYSPINNRRGNTYSAWLDRFDQDLGKFTNGHVVSTYKFVPLEFSLSASLFGAPYVLYTEGWGRRQYAFEVAPFYKYGMDLPPVGPRSTAYPSPPMSPILPSFETWPGLLQPGEYPALTDWDPENAGARLLTQKTEPDSSHVAMLGINACGSRDPVVNTEGNIITLAQLVVAFWGPDFTPELLRSLDPDGNDNQSLESGVLLWDKGDFAGIGTPVSFINSQDLSNYSDTPLPIVHNMVPVTGLRWGSAPEFIDLNGDGLANDMNGDDIIDESDKAWVLTLYPRNHWQLPETDDLDSGNAGCDLYVTVSTSDKLARFQQFRAVVPATLPSRAENRRKAGIQFYPPVNTSPKAFLKANGEEDPVAPYYGHDMLQSNIPLRIEDMAQGWSDINIGGAAVPALGLNIATNRESGTVARGDGGVGYDRGFSVPGQRWTPGSLVGDFLIDDHYTSYEIIGNTENALTLLSGMPRNGAWRVVRDPSFLEELTVELYQEGDFATMNPLTDLLPLDMDQRISGIAVYRDNDNHPRNRNGMFDPDIDIPLALDAPPRFSGRTADELKVRFVFSTPGTSDFPIPRAEQARNRQWVHDSFGTKVSDPENGPDFFVVLRASTDMQLDDNFRVGIVSWGPSTPSEPDPHIWANLDGEDRNDFLKFREFKWAERGVGFITYFKEPPVSYYLHGAKSSQRPDTSGLNWIRSHSTKKGRSGIITGRERPLGPQSLVIESASQSRLPIQTLPGQGFSFLIYGKNFGNSPMVALSGYDLTVNSAVNDRISVTINTRADRTPEEPLTLVVRNPVTGDEASRSDLFSLTSNLDVYGPRILRVTPAQGRKENFPVVVEGTNFFNAVALEVYFGETRMPILEVSTDGTAITVGFPVGGMPQTGLLDVSVISGSKDGGEDVIINGFEYINPESRPKVRFFGCAPRRDAGSGFAGDVLLLGAVVVALAATRFRRKSNA